MTSLDWIVLILTLAATIAYGLYKSRTSHSLDGYILSNRSMNWGLILLSIMGTQASAITFISAPGQAYTDGMRFVQYYFGLPLAAVVVCIFFDIVTKPLREKTLAVVHPVVNHIRRGDCEKLPVAGILTRDDQLSRAAVA